VRVLVVSDTHAPRRWRGLPRGLAAALASGPDLVLHAGDACRAELLEELAAWAPVRAVLGNNDGEDVRAWGAPPTLEAELAGVRVAMIHDAGVRQGRPARLRRRFPGADLVVFGHSHSPADLRDPATGLRLLNPGSPTDPRREPFGTFAELVLDDGAVASVTLRPADR